MQKWEYKVLTEPSNRPNLQDSFNELGQESWELVSATTMRAEVSMYVTVFTFKREIPEPQAEHSQRGDFSQQMLDDA